MQACMSIKNGSQDQGQVLRWFGQKQGEAEKHMLAMLPRESILDVVVGLQVADSCAL